MGKKKGKKADRSGDVASNDAAELGSLAVETENSSLPPKQSAKMKKKKNEDNWEDDVLNEIEQLSLEGKKPKDDAINTQTKANDKDTTENADTTATGDKKSEKKDTAESTVGDIDAKKTNQAALDLDDNLQQDEEKITIKTKAQKQAEKKEREKKKKEQQKLERRRKQEKEASQMEGVAAESVTKSEEKPADEGGKPGVEIGTEDAPEQGKEEASTSSKKKDKKKKKSTTEKDEKAKSTRKPNKAMIKAMQDRLNKIKEEEEKRKQQEEEEERKAEEEKQRLLQKKEEERLRKERKKQKEKEKILRLKREGKYLTPAQKEAQRKRDAYVESLRQQGLFPVEKTQNDKPKKVSYENKRRKKQEPAEDSAVQEEPAAQETEADLTSVEEHQDKGDDEVAEEVEDDVIDDWEALSDSDDAASEQSQGSKGEPEDAELNDSDVDEADADVDSKDDAEDADQSEDDFDEVDIPEDVTPRQRALLRIQYRKERHERKRNLDELRSPVICVMGHVDTGKTKILDKIRHSHVQDNEAGGITQQIGATSVPVEVIREQTKMVKSFQDFEIRFPGLLVIDTPGHESFSNLRSRGSSVCDMAILVVDIMHGLESQTLESIAMLKKRKTPFVVALNKVDRLYEWKRGPDSDIVATMKKQKRHVKDEFDERLKEIIVQFATQNLNVKLFYENDDPKEWISMVPTSAHSGDGMGNLIALVVQLCQSMLPKRLSYCEELESTVLEVKAILGLGTTVDVILTNGRLKSGDTIVLAGVEGPIVTHIKGLLMPQPLKELRVKNPYNKYNELKAAQGIKILAKDLDKAIAGTQLLVAHNEDEIEVLKEQIQADVDKTLKSYKLQERGVFVQASTLGSLEALLTFLKQSQIPYAGISIGPVHKKDIMKASVMLEHDPQWAVILAFDVKVEREAQDLADNLGVKIFTADIIYHLFDAFMQHREDLKKQKQEEFRNIAVFPCKLRIMPNCVFKSRDPIVVGVSVEAGQLRQNTPICIPSKEFLTVGYVTSMEFNHKPVEIARVGQEVCIKIEGAPGETPKMVGRHFEETDVLVSKISRDSINALKDWFRDEMTKPDWQLTIELKKLFDII